MASLDHKVRNAQNEGRILVLGAQVLIGWEYGSFFMAGVGELSPISRSLKLLALALNLAALAILVAPVTFRWLVEEGEDSARLFHFVKACTGRALLPLAMGMVIDLFLVAEHIVGRSAGLAVAALTFAMTMFFWYGLEHYTARRVHPSGYREMLERKIMEEDRDRPPTDLTHKIGHVLTEARVVLPGAQALLGFQLGSTLTSGFDQVPPSSRYVHLASLLAIAVTTILLITPAAYHRIVEHGEDSERFFLFAGRMVIAATVPLGLGLVGDLYVVARQATGSVALSIVTAAVAAVAFTFLWYVYMAIQRARPRPARDQGSR